MGRFNKSNFKKTIYYLKRNGIKNTWYAVRERLDERKSAPYSFVPVSEEELENQRKWAADKSILFSIVVPAYRTNETYLREMIQSVVGQSYPHWELILADATEDESVKKIVDKIACDINGSIDMSDKIKYVKLIENAGIAANTNQALTHTKGDYVGLLDHDDVLTGNALYEMAVCIEEGQKQGLEPQMLYSDEDKCNGDRTHYYEPNWKEKFNLDLLLSNNYICHFLVMKAELIKELGFRSEYDGAQDYDLVLRAAGKLCVSDKQQKTDGLIVHIPKVLYHWRCHTGSTAENPQSKQYAYDAGLRALQDFSDSMGYGAKAVHLKHLGFYTLQYQGSPFKVRSNLAVIGGRVFGKKGLFGDWKIIGGRMENLNGKEGDNLFREQCVKDGCRVKIFYRGLLETYSGYLHRAVLTQAAEALDIRCIQVREECRELFEQIVGVPYREVYCEKNNHDLIFDASALPAGTDYIEISLQLAKAFMDAGYSMMYSPALYTRWKGEQR